MNEMPEYPKATILGKPVSHARSPLIHGFWLKAMDLHGSYDRSELEPGAVGAFMRGLAARGYRGGNVTVPHKEEAFTACDRVSEAARIARAVNTFWFEGALLCGDNTDGSGFVAHLDESYPGWDRAKPRILVLGAGGAARGIIIPLLNRKIENLTISNRSPERADAVITDICAERPAARINRADWAAVQDLLPSVDLLINTTSLGMAGKGTLTLDLGSLPAQAIVADIVYVPLETDLLRQARERGLRTLDGLGMLLHQAVPGFERWFGRKPEVDAALRAFILADLDGS
jgi:shikimate dehydrogenase